MNEYNITLMDGRILSCTLKAHQPKVIKSDDLELDKTGEYLSFGRLKIKEHAEDLLQKAQRQYNHHLLTENAWFLLENAEKILSDSRMFLAPVKIQNGLAYTGTSGFSSPTLGVYIEWWLNCKEASTDANGNLVWYISGSPLSGSNCCSAVTPKGEQVKIAQRTPFSAIWRTFMSVNKRYTEAKQRCEAYSLEEVLTKLHGDDYKYRIIDLQHEMINKEMFADMNLLQKAYSKVAAKIEKLITENKKIELNHHRDSILAFMKGFMERKHKIMELEKVYVTKHRELKRQLHSGTINGDYHFLLAEASKEYRAEKRVQSESINRFVRETFGRNPNGITPSDILRYVKSLIKN